MSSYDKYISFSQYRMWSKCPYYHYLSYVKREIPRRENKYMLGGKIIHEIFQDIVKDYYNFKLDTTESYLSDLISEGNACDPHNDCSVTNLQQHISLYSDRIENFIDFLEENYPKEEYSFVENEHKILFPLGDKLNTEDIKLTRYEYKFVGYIDIILDDGNKYHLIDLKTSKNGWGWYQKNDEVKKSQLRFYREFYAMLKNRDWLDIETDYWIVPSLKSKPVEKFHVEHDRELLEDNIRKMRNMVYHAYENDYHPYSKTCGDFCDCKEECVTGRDVRALP